MTSSSPSSTHLPTASPRPVQPGVGCRLCGSTETAPLYCINGCSIYKCRNCDAEFVANFTGDAAENSEKFIALQSDTFDDESFSNSSNAGVVRHWQREAQEIDRLTADRSGGKRILDIGCNDGLFLGCFNASWQKFGIEIAPGVAAKARAKGITVFEKPVEEISIEPQSLDAITMYMIVEHLQDPVQSMAHIVRWLKPGGVLVMLTGDSDTFKVRRVKAKWHMYTPPVHQFFFSRRSLEFLFKSCGLQTVHYKYTYGGMPVSTFKPLRLVEHAVGKMTAASPINQLPLYDHLYLYARKRP
ncbi:MAG: class I SAM-dependent methyltransferase [Rhizobacter sp.]|nr:class I SAM-dependent methyltransferase [Chlorobiales bacterium]